MATLQQLEAAFVKADDAGATEDAAAFAAEIRKMRAAPPPRMQPNAEQSGAIPAGGEAPWIGRRILNALTAGVPQGPDMRTAMNSGALSANTEMGMGGLTMPEANAAAATTVAAAARYGIPVAGTVVGGAPGGVGGAAAGEALAQRIEGGPMRTGAIVGAGLSNMFPGVSTVGRGVLPVIKEVAKQGAANMLGTSAEMGIDKKRAPTGRELAISGGFGAASPVVGRVLDQGANAAAAAASAAAARKGFERETLAIGRELEYVLPPSVVSPGAINDTMHSLGGKAAMAQKVIERNQPITDIRILEDLRLPANTKLGPTAIETAKLVPNKAYADAAAVSPQAKILIEEFKDMNAEANKLFLFYTTSQVKDPKVLKDAQAFKAGAQNALTRLKAEATARGQPEIGPRFEDARMMLSKIALAESAMNRGNGSFDAAIFGKALDGEKIGWEKLTGNMQKIGRFQQAFWRYVRDPADSLPSGVNQLNVTLPAALGAAGTLGGGAGGYATGGIPGALGGAAAGAFLGQAVPKSAREIALSDFWQRYMMKPNYGTGRPDMQAILARFVTQGEGREVASQQQPQRPVPYR